MTEKQKVALITGADGQDGSFLAELLLSKNYSVHGLLRRGVNTPANISHLRERITTSYGDMATENHLCKLLHELQPDEIYNLAGQSDVAASFDIPEYTGDVTGLGVVRLLEAAKTFSPHSKFYQASSSEIFGNAPAPQNEKTPFKARSPYAAAKIYAHHITVNYRESYGMFTCCGILFNHESERRGLNFVTRKISNAVARISWGKQDTLELGNTLSERDWGYSPDYMRAIWLMMQQETPDDYVIGTGETHSVQDFVEAAFNCVSLDWRNFVKTNTAGFIRPGEVNCLRADATKAKRELGWVPDTKFERLVSLMVDSDLRLEEDHR